MKNAYGVLILIALIGFSAGAEKLDIHTHDEVIQRLESVLDGVKGQASEVQVHIRLADLYADRARLQSTQEIESNCKSCTGSKSDRAKAISHYEKAFSKSKAEQQARILLQIAHLHSSNGESKDAKRVFTTILSSKNKYSNELIGESLAGLGEIAYQEGKFEEAKKHFTSALKYPISKQHFVRYRLAWCHLNSGDVNHAKAILLSLLNEKTGVDQSFRKDLTHDLATFIARGKVDQSTVTELLNLSADAEKKSNLFYLGKECDRLGNKQGSILIWEMYTRLNDLSGEDGVEIKIRLAQSLWDQGQFQDSLNQYDSFYKEFSKLSCDNKTLCDELRAQSRTYVHTWIKKYKTNPSIELLGALKTYSLYNDEDVEMITWTAHIARQLKDHKTATQYYRLSADQSFSLLKNKNIESEKSDFLKKTMEGSLLSEIESAEAASDKTEMMAAYNHYLKINQNGEKSDEVYYQIAYQHYKSGDHKLAIQSFHNLVINSKKLELSKKIQAADLTLDALSIEKRHEDIEQYSKVYANLFSHKKLEYTRISRQAAVNQSVAKYKNGMATQTEMKSALSKLSGASLAGASVEEKLKIFKNEILIAEKIRDLDALDSSAIKILNLKGVGQTDIDYALERRLWVAEMRLDFKRAAKFAQSTSLNNLSQEERYLKLAVLTDLSGRSSRSYYEEYLSVAKNTERANLVRMKLVQESKMPWSELAKFKNQLKKSPNIYGQTLLNVFARQQDIGSLKIYAQEQAIRKSSAAPTLSRFITLENNKDLDLNLRKHKLNTSNTAKIKTSLTQRLALLTKVDKLANQALQSGDFILQVEALNRVSRENKRLYNEVVRMPVPRGLSKAQKTEYAKLIAAQAEPYLKKSNLAINKSEEIWRTSKAFKELLSATMEERGAPRALMVRELRLLSRYASNSNKRDIENAISHSAKTVKSSEIVSVHNDIAKDPFDSSNISKLKNLEEIRGRSTMVAYLEARLSAMEKGKL